MGISRVDEFDTLRVGIRHEPLFLGIATVAAEQSLDFLPNQSASVLWAFATCRVPASDGLIMRIEVAVHRDICQYTPRHVAGMLWSLATLHAQCEPLTACLVSGVMTEGLSGLASDGPAHLASIAW